MERAEAFEIYVFPMKSFLRSLPVLLAVGLVWLSIVASAWLLGPTDDDLLTEALLRSDAAKPHGQRNAFVALYVFDRDVPEAAWEQVVADDVAHVNAMLSSDPAVDALTAFADSPYQKLASLPDDASFLCESWKPDCLSRVRTDPQRAREVIDRHTEHLARGDRLSTLDHYRSGFIPHLSAPLHVPVSSYFRLLLTSVALLHIEGKSSAALNTLCRATSVWRRLRANTDSLLVDALGMSIMSSSAQLVSGILSELPAEKALPCPQVFAPLAEREFNQCPIVASELRSMENSWRSQGFGNTSTMQNPPSSWFSRQMFEQIDLEQLVRVSARGLSQWCSPAHLERIALRRPERLAPPDGCRAAEKIWDPTGLGVRLIC